MRSCSAGRCAINHCPECGAPRAADDSCRERFDRCLAREFSDPAYGAVHHLTVAAYVLQHPSRLSRPGWLAMRDLLSRFLREGVAPAEVVSAGRRDASLVFGAGRSWRFTSGSAVELPAGFAWTQTIPDAADEPSDAYGAAITGWAGAVLEDALRLEPPTV